MNRIALVHDWFARIAGSEKVVREMKHCYPSSDIFSLVNHLTQDELKELGVEDISTSFIQRLPFSQKLFRHYLPLMPMAIEQLDLSSYDVVLSSSHAVAKGVLTNSQQLHISYVHTPIRYAWDMFHEYIDSYHGLKALMVKLTLHYMRMWDRSTANRPDIYVANSKYVASRIRKTYGQDAEVIYPPVDIERFQTTYQKEDFYLAAGRLVPYKRFDVVVDAFSQLPDQKLVLIGDGPELKTLRARAPQNVKILGYQDDTVLFDYLSKARAFLFAGIEDFGIMPVEAQACGTPVLGINRGGVAESVIHGETGLLFEEQTAECVADTVRFFDLLPSNYFDPQHLHSHTERFGIERFRDEFSSLVDNAWESRKVTSDSTLSRPHIHSYQLQLQQG